MPVRTNLKTWMVVSLFLLVMAAAAGAKTIYVDADAPGSGTGANWANAYPYLQDALADANTSAKPVEIRVAQGTYKPYEGAGVTEGDREATFGLMNGVTLKGGYAGDGEPDPNARDIDNYETILSGDLDGNDVPVGDPCDLLDHPNRAENSYHVVTGSGINASAVLDGFTITAGNANGASGPADAGGGLYNNDSTHALLNCTFVANSAGHGGGMSRWDDLDRPMTITNCTFNNNFAASSGGGIYGERMTLANCTFTNNSAVYYGGLYSVGSATLISCMFINNSAEGSAGGMQVYRGQLTLTNCTFVGNSAGNYAGGLRIRVCDATLTNCTFIGNSSGTYGGGVWTMLLPDQLDRFINCTFSGNSASDDGGGFYSSHDFSEITNCTFSENKAGGDGGAFCVSVNGGTAGFNNCILWGNTAGNEGPQIAIKSSLATVSIAYSDVEGGNSPSAIYVESGTLNWGSGNLNDDPLFVDADGPDNTAGTEDDDLHLLGDSNCIDAGDNTAVPVDVNEDLDGNPRIIDGTVDMGAYETRPFIYVDTDAAGDNDGTSWTNAHNYLQDALSAAKGGWGEILVAEGTYKPDQGSEVTAGDRLATFLLKNGIDLTGGYAGSGEPDPNKRNINTYQTILSGDLDGNDVPITDPCELENEPSRAENSYHVVTGAGNVTMDGFIITGGHANGSTPNNRGGGMYNGAADPVVQNCTLTANWASSGGGIYNDASSSPTVTGCILHSNASNNGGGMYNSSDSTQVTNCTFSDNLANLDGGGIYSYQTCPQVNSSILYNNTDNGGTDESAQIYPYFYFGSDQVNYSCIQGWGGTLGGTGNISSDPCFVDAGNDDYHIRWSSDCINTGDPSFAFDANEREIDGEPRVMVGRVDMGADETSEKQADFTRNGRIDTQDLRVLVRSWLTIPVDNNWYVLCDLQEDERINLRDCAHLAGDWLWRAGWYEP